jgi:hypothetical protein
VNPPLILSASRRTDIPAFFSDWFMNRIRAGFCVYPNPLRPRTLHRVDLRPESVLGIVFWTRNPVPMLQHLDQLDRVGHAYCFLMTLNGYPPSIEPRSPLREAAVKAFVSLSERIGSDGVVWRYDPVILSPRTPAAWHRENFARLLDRLAGKTRRLIVSVVDPCRKTLRGLGTDRDGIVYDPAAYRDLLAWMAAAATGHGLSIQSCAEPVLVSAGIPAGRCVDGNLLLARRRERGLDSEPLRFALHRQREACLCHRSVDIGVNNTCGFGCTYCYATSDPERARDLLLRHDSASPCMAARQTGIDPHYRC